MTDRLVPDLELPRQNVDVIPTGLRGMVELLVRQEESAGKVVGQPDARNTDGFRAQLVGSSENRGHGFGLRHQRQLCGHLESPLPRREPMGDTQHSGGGIKSAFRRI
ncbi:Uncharacterised protein [Mycobacteroides abscessus]|nr:Uncharacterised protein [Mycobacteroides abscessus]